MQRVITPLSGKVFDLRLRGHWFKLYQTHFVVSLSKTLYLSTGSVQEMSQHDRKIVNWDVKHQLKQIVPHICVCRETKCPTEEVV